MSELHTFKEQLGKYLSRTDNPAENLIKFEVGNGPDFSFIINLDLWANYFKIEDSRPFNNDILIYATDNENNDEKHAIEALKNESEKFAFKIDSLEVKNMKCFIKLMRNSTFKTMFKSISSDDFGRAPKCDETMSINIIETENSSITNFRLQTIELVLKNLISYSQYTLTDDSTADHKVLLTTRSNFKKDNDCLDTDITVLCSVVRDMDKNNKKISHQSTNDYLKKRIDDMHLMALHKYGVRIKSDDNFLKLKEKLGTAAAKFDMIEVKHSNPVTLTFDIKQAFILYNSARIETLLKSFDEKVASGYYQPLPELDNIDMNLLTDNEEWNLLKQLMLFPEVIKNSIVDLKNGKIGLHLLYKYLQNLAIAFSNYYSKKKVLTENRPQLMPILHAKIHLLKAIRAIFNKTLSIFDIEPVSFM
ncbi:uncharacterized protein [Chironomus tepperi]|uniref:uncharacterized protein n=1 Tax=Chironomus tepperi TaxID=113505 RepID=UPI00391F685E